MNIPTTTKTAAPVETTSNVSIDASKLVRASFKSPTADSQPCNWDITSVGDGSVVCKNNVSGSTFEGTIAEFSAALKEL